MEEQVWVKVIGFDLECVELGAPNGHASGGPGLESVAMTRHL